MIYFGTDGIRGIAGEDLTFDLCHKCGNALSKLKKNCRIILGTDTRKSASFVMSSFVSGAVMGGASVVDVGIVPTPAISFLTKKLGFDFGVMITASHNPAEYNGIKIFDCGGEKISTEKENLIEKMFVTQYIQKSIKMGRYEKKHKYAKIYENFLIKKVGTDLSNLSVVVDASNGSNYLIARKVLTKLGAKVTKINSAFRGECINKNCGALFPQKLSSVVTKIGADIGVAFDGDADRICVVDEKGRMVDGDQILLFLTQMYSQFQKNICGAVVGTIQTNLAVEKELNKLGMKLIRTDVGDKFVTKELMSKNLQLGAEQSGHIILTDYEKTGDGLLCTIVICNFLKMSGENMSKCVFWNLISQSQHNFEVKDKLGVINSPTIKVAVAECESMLNGTGRVVVRASGTESKIRVMVETNEKKLADRIMKKMENAINSVLN